MAALRASIWCPCPSSNADRSARRSWWDGESDARCFNPQGAFRPTLYGTVLHVKPDGGAPFLLRGTRSPGNVAAGDRAADWTRHGGAAEAAVPGGRVPIFPSGGLHFDRRLGVRTPKDATITELSPAGPFGGSGDSFFP